MIYLTICFLGWVNAALCATSHDPETESWQALQKKASSCLKRFSQDDGSLIKIYATSCRDNATAGVSVIKQYPGNSQPTKSLSVKIAPLKEAGLGDVLPYASVKIFLKRYTDTPQITTASVDISMPNTQEAKARVNITPPHNAQATNFLTNTIEYEGKGASLISNIVCQSYFSQSSTNIKSFLFRCDSRSGFCVQTVVNYDDLSSPQVSCGPAFFDGGSVVRSFSDRFRF